jgi:hypothetical protein
VFTPTAKAMFFGVHGLRDWNPSLFEADLATLANLLSERKIKPLVAACYGACAAGQTLGLRTDTLSPGGICLRTGCHPQRY